MMSTLRQYSSKLYPKSLLNFILKSIDTKDNAALKLIQYAWIIYVGIYNSYMLNMRDTSIWEVSCS